MKNWKTTLLGILAGVLVTVGGSIQSSQLAGTPTKLNLTSVLNGAAIAAMGALTKDHDKD